MFVGKKSASDCGSERNWANLLEEKNTPLVTRPASASSSFSGGLVMLVLERHVLLHGTPSHSASVFAASNLKFQAATSSYSVNYRPLPSLYWATATFGLGDDNLQRPNARRRPRDLQFVLSATQQADGIEDPENRAPLVESDSTEHGNGNDNANGDCAQRLTSQDGQAGTRSSSLSPVSSEYPSPPLDVLYRDQHIA